MVLLEESLCTDAQKIAPQGDPWLRDASIYAGADPEPRAGKAHAGFQSE